MKTIYEARITPTWQPRDFDDKAEAEAFVEAAGAGRIVTFVRDYDGRDRSCAMVTYEAGSWTGHEIVQR